MRSFSYLLPIAAAAAFTFVSQPLAAAEQLRLSQASGLGNTQGSATESALAYDSDRDRVLVVWFGHDDQLDGGSSQFIVSGRLVDARSGVPIGPAVRLDTGATGINALTPDVVYNPIEGEYLVAWAAETVATHSEIVVQRFDAATLQPLLAQPRQITEMGGPGDLNYSAYAPALAFNPNRNEYLVACIASDSRIGMTDLQRDVFIQRLDGRDGGEIGVDDMRISAASSADGLRQVSLSSGVDVAYSTINQNYLVVWSADSAAAGLANDEFEIFAQLIDGATGAERFPDDPKLTTVGPAGNAFFDAEQPSVSAYDSNFVVAYSADLVQGIKEIFAIRAGGTSGLPFNTAQRMTVTSGGAARWPEIVLEPASGELLIAFQSREVLGSTPVFETEVFVQRSSQNLVPIGAMERWSVLGPDGSADFGPSPGVSITTLGSQGGYLVGWSGDDDRSGQIDNEFEVFARSSVVDALFSDGFE